jgi:carbon storage regulator CsrA
MLVLTRKVGESIVLSLDDGTALGTIHVTSLTDGRVRLGFELPRSVEVERTELRNRKEEALTT